MLIWAHVLLSTHASSHDSWFRRVDAIVCFGIAFGCEILIVLPFVLLYAFWVDDSSENGIDMYREFMNKKNEEYLKIQKHILDNVIDDEILNK